MLRGDLIALNKKVLDHVPDEFIGKDIDTVYNNHLYKHEYILEFDIADDEVAKVIYDNNFRLIYDILKNYGVDMTNTHTVLITEKTYNSLFTHIENTLKNTTLLDIATTEYEYNDNVDKNIFEIYNILIELYKSMKYFSVDFDKEFVLFTKDY